MDITIVDDKLDLEEMNRVMDGHSARSNGECPDWGDMNKYPRKQWLWFSGIKGDEHAPFVVVDNRDGECFVEQFATLDGAMLYICDCHMTCEDQEDWDYSGAVRDREGFFEKEDEQKEAEDVSE